MSSFSAWAHGRVMALAVVAAGFAVGCVVDDRTGSEPIPPSYTGTGGGSGSSSGGGSTSNTQPMLVDVDPNRTMTATPGQGVGVFTEYQTGGHWHVWWTCDTSKTDLGCAFDVTVSVASGTIANLAGQALESSDRLVQASPQQIEATTTTTGATDGVTFDTPVDANGDVPVITLDAKLNGQEDGSFLFFVQDGKINGGYPSPVTDPLMLEPSTP